MEALLAKHWPALSGAQLVTDEPAVVYRGLPKGDESATTTYVEIFSWASESAPHTAHELPEVLAVWEPMGALCESMEFPHFKRLDLTSR